VLISAGFDAHRSDPLTGLGLSAGDYAAISERVAAWSRPGRLISFLEGGYDLDALRDSVAASLPALVGAAAAPIEGESPTGGGPGTTVVDAVADLWRRYESGAPESFGG
jgi:acetoin utilization deacetylase AcuC-like enzyme